MRFGARRGYTAAKPAWRTVTVMSYAVVEDLPASWLAYAPVAEEIEALAPEGLILLVAGPTDEGIRTIGVWESRQAWERFRSEMSLPDASGLAPAPTRRELDVRTTVRGRPVREEPS